MIKLAIKHWVFDRCISVLFDTIKENFSLRKKLTINTISIGDEFEYLYVYSAFDKKWTFKYFDCIVTDFIEEHSFCFIPQYSCENYMNAKLNSVDLYDDPPDTYNAYFDHIILFKRRRK